MVILISISCSSQWTCVVWSLLFHRLLIYIATAPSCSLLAALNEKPPQALQQREIQQPCKTMLWDIFCLILRPQLFRECSAFFSWLASLVSSLLHTSGEKEGLFLHKMDVQATPEATFSLKSSTDIFLWWKIEPLLFLSQIIACWIPVFKNHRQYVLLTEPRERSRNSSNASKHEDTLNWWEVPVTSFAVTRHPSCVFVSSPAWAPWEVGPLKTGLTA